ncbi:hypothetical protein INT45_000269 [Circinella minor]|uniref:AMP-dependent synthetase/ligase domain-containing protein n=1 Tax=Circinella minor TaxID=1195481 RepID=A0A8H7VKS7_9FUNG|nr:hypothetical protein INT45_000269 [Circinella minor]
MSYTEYDSLLQAFKLHAEYHKNRTLVRYYYHSESSSKPKIKTLTYNQVDKITDYVAKEWKKTIPPSSFVPGQQQPQCIVTLIDNSLQSILAFFTILKLGVAYLPIRDCYNKELIAHLLEQSNATYIIASKIYREEAFKAIEILHQVKKSKEEDQSAIGVKIWDDFDINQLVILTSEPTQQHQIENMSHHNNSIEYFELSGGSTGKYPKIIRRTAQQFLYSMMETMVSPIQQQQQESDGEEKRWLKSNDVVLFTSNINVGSIITKLFACIFAGASIIVFYQSSLPTVHEIITAAEMCKPSIMFGPPTVLEKLAIYLLEKEEKGISLDEQLVIDNVFKSIKICLFAGAPLRLWVETGGISVYNNLCLNEYKQKWNSIKFSSAHMNYLLFEPLNNNIDNEFYHLVIRNTHAGLASHAANRPNGDMDTKDLFRKDTDESGDYWWTHFGRMNDIFIMKDEYNGTNPILIEYEMYNEPIIEKCILIGKNRRHTAVLVELTNNKTINKCSTLEEMVTKGSMSIELI